MGDPCEQCTFGWLAGHDSGVITQNSEGSGLLIEAKSSLARFVIGSVTLKTVFGQDRSNVASEIYAFTTLSLDRGAQQVGVQGWE
jgi:hypothetical protein